MIVYRLEDDEGYGVWSGFNGGRAMLEGYYGRWKQGCTVYAWNFSWSNYRYGCENLESLMQYFGTAFGHLLNSGRFQVVKYEVRKNHVRFSEIEVVFNLNKAKRLGVVGATASAQRPDTIRDDGFKRFYFDELAVLKTDNPYGAVRIDPV